MPLTESEEAQYNRLWDALIKEQEKSASLERELKRVCILARKAKEVLDEI